MLLDSMRRKLHEGPRLGAVRMMSSEGIRLVAADAIVIDGAAGAGADGGPVGVGDVVFDILAEHPGSSATVALTWPLVDARLFWRVGMRPFGPAQPVDWEGLTQVSLVNSAPMGCLLDAADRNVMAFAYSHATDEIGMRYGVDEEHATFTVVLEIARVPACSRLRLTDRNIAAADVIHTLNLWMGADVAYFPMSSGAVEPVFSTWYAYLQNIDDVELRMQAAGIRELGCRSVFIDDGWQAFGHGRGYAGCGDWVPDGVKFPDMAVTVGALRDEGLRTVLWIAPLLLGERSHAFERMERYAPLPMDGKPECGCRILDPRRAAVRDYVAGVCARLMRDYGVGGLKIDFLDQARLYQGQQLDDHVPGDVADVGEAMRMLLAQVRDALLAQGGDDVPVVEFRQPYSSPAIAPYSNVVRASDCPGDSVTNRMRVIDERLASTGRMVHGDMLLWHPAAGGDACAEQIMATFFAVPQISVRPSSMSPEQYAVCRYLLHVWREHHDTVLFGSLEPVGVAEGYPLVSAYRGDEQVSAVYGRAMVVDVDATAVRRLLVLNASHEPAVTLRLRGDDCAVRLAGTAYDCRGAAVGTWDGVETVAVGETPDPGSDLGTGFLRLRVPPYGVAELTVG